MEKFIELTLTAQGGGKISINVRHIAAYHKHGANSAVMLSGVSTAIGVTENTAQIKAAITAAG